MIFNRCKQLYLLYIGACAAVSFFHPVAQAEPTLDVVAFESHTLQNNPLHDPTQRKLAIFLPSQITNQTALPVVYYLPGYGGSCESFIKTKDQWTKYVQ